MARYNPLPQQRYIQPAAQKDFELWTANRLKHLMGLEDVDALVQDLFAKETSQEVHEWVESVLGWERKAVKKFYENFVEKRVKTSAIFRLANDRSQARVVEQASTAEFEAYKKPELGEDGFMSLKAKAKAQKKQEEAQAQAQAQLQQQKAAVKQKKRNQRRNRRICDCQGLKCGVYMNCLWCGRVTCETEGPGPCFFCHHEVDVDNPTHVFSEERQDKKKKGSPQTTRAEEASTEMDEGLARALLRKDELLEYERNSARRTVVYDDHEDYFSVDSTKWLTAEEKKRMKEKEEEMKKKKEENARKITVSFDLAGRKVIHANDEIVSSDGAFVSEGDLSKSGFLFNPSLDVPNPLYTSDDLPPASQQQTTSTEDPGQKKKRRRRKKKEQQPTHEQQIAKKREALTSKRIQHEYFVADEDTSSWPASSSSSGAGGSSSAASGSMQWADMVDDADDDDYFDDDYDDAPSFAARRH